MLTVGHGDNIVLGDDGLIDFTRADRTTTAGADTNANDIDFIQSTSTTANGGIDTITSGDGTDIVIGGRYGDTIDAGTGNNLVFGDSGEIIAADDNVSAMFGNLPIILGLVQTISPDDGGADDIDTGLGVDIVLGGDEGDTIDVNNGEDGANPDAGNLVLGDAGFIDWVGLDGVAATLYQISSTDFAIGGQDTINAGTGGDVILGGADNDTINGSDGFNIVFGDSGLLTAAEAVAVNLVALGMSLSRAESLAPSVGGADGITTGVNADIILGGDDVDTIDAGQGDNLVLGDNGQIDVTSGGANLGIMPITLLNVTTWTPTEGAGDFITTGLGEDIVLGGLGGDVITTNNGEDPVTGDNRTSPHTAAYPTSPDSADIILGDHGFIKFENINSNTTYRAEEIKSTDVQQGGADTITSGAGNDIILGGSEGDWIDGGADNDLVLGDHGHVYGDIDETKLPLHTGEVFDFASIHYSDTDNAGDDTILAGSGDDMVLGQQGFDTIFGQDGDDDLIGGHNVDPAMATFDTGDAIDGGQGDDVILGDNGRIYRANDDLDTRLRVLEGTVIYSEDIDTDDGDALVTADHQSTVDDVDQRDVEIFDHSDTADPDQYGNDYIAGGADDDLIFGQMGDDVIQGDGTIDQDEDTIADTVDGDATAVDAWRDSSNLLQVDASWEDWANSGGAVDRDGDDAIQGNGGQDDIIGGSSSLYVGLDGGQENRPDGSDLIFGGAGEGNDYNDPGNYGHVRDADVIVGDNGNIYRLVGANGSSTNAYLTFQYDDYGESNSEGALNIIPRAVELVDYAEGGLDWDAAAALDNGAADEIHGEDGDDVIYGMTGGDVLFGEGQDDDIIGGTGHDWISGGTGQDGVLGDDGRIYTSRNNTSAETLYDIDGFSAGDLDKEISTPGNMQVEIINVSGALKKSVNLTPFNVDPLDEPTFDQVDTKADDIIFGGLGSDFLHGGVGDDAISGAEALEDAWAITLDGGVFVVLEQVGYLAPSNSGDLLRFGVARAGEMGAYDEYDPLSQIDGAGSEVFFMDFDPLAGAEFIGDIGHDGDDVLFGDLGNDWIVGGTGEDHAYGGYGNDLLDMDDDKTTNGGANDVPDTDPTYEDRAYGGAGRDVLIANTGGDRLIDWVGEFNSYLVPFAPYGAATISRALQPQIAEFLYDQSESDGVDMTRADDTLADPARNGEPMGELGLVLQKDADWQDQTGAPDDPQAGNIPGGSRDVLRSASFSQGNADGFAADSGTWTVSKGALEVAPENLGEDAVSVFYVDHSLPSYYEVRATINGGKPIAGLKSNAYLIFDYQSEFDFKFAGVNVSKDKLEIGYRDASGWHVVDQDNARLKPKTNYNLLLSVNGTVVTLVVDNKEYFSHVFDPHVDDDGFTYGLNYGMVGIGANNSVARIDNVVVQVLPPELTYEETSDFDNDAGLFDQNVVGDWNVGGGVLAAAPAAGADTALATTNMSVGEGYLVQVSAELTTGDIGGFVFDYYAADDFKFAALDVSNDQIIIGHYTARDGWVVDAAYGKKLMSNKSYDLEVTLKGSTVSVSLDGHVVLGHVFNGLTVDGAFGLLSHGGETEFDSATAATNDPAYESDPEALQVAQASAEYLAAAEAIAQLSTADLAPLVAAAKARWAETGRLSAEQLGRLEQLSVNIADLDGGLLGTTVVNTVTADDDGAGFGWFLDPTPAADEEFDAEGGAIAGSGAQGRMDLLTVLAHEIGHALGFGHDTDAASADVMDANLTTGTRLMPAAEAEVAAAAPVIQAETLLLPTVDELIAAISNSEIVIATDLESKAKKKSTGNSYMYDPDSDSFTEVADAGGDGIEDAMYELFDENGALFAYIDTAGDMWVIDDLAGSGGNSGDGGEDWIYIS